LSTALCTIAAHNTAENRPHNLPSYPADNYHCSDDVSLREGGTPAKDSWDVRPLSSQWMHTVSVMHGQCNTQPMATFPAA